MEETNFAGNGEQKRLEQLFCSADITSEMHYQLILISALNTLLSKTACLENIAFLVALHKESSLRWELLIVAGRGKNVAGRG